MKLLWCHAKIHGNSKPSNTIIIFIDILF